jgi:2-haloacid dehalogenase
VPIETASLKALVFDVGGTVFDWHGSIQDEVQALAKQRGVTCDGSAFAIDWRQRMFTLLEQMTAGALPWTNADGLHRQALEEILSDYPQLELTSGARDELNDVWHRLRVWPDFPAALDRLRANFTVTVLTVLSWAIVVDSSKHCGLSWDGVLSCEFLGAYKPDPDAYLSAVRLLRVRPHQVMMVAAHPGDLRAAAAAGYRTAFVARHEQGQSDSRAAAYFGDDPTGAPFDVSVETFSELVAELG